MKHISKFLLVLLVSTTVFQAYANPYDVNIQGICYKLIGGEAMVTVSSEYEDHNANFYTGSIVIPDTISYKYKKYPVTTIGPKTFFNCYDLTEICLPNTLTTIMSEAFKGNIYLEKVHIGANLKEIANNAFSNTWITELEIDPANPYLLLDGNVLYTSDHKRAITLVAKKYSTDNDVHFHDDLESIDDGFAAGRRIRTLHFGNKLKSIGREAFYWSLKEEDCLQTTLYLPDGITHIGEQAFEFCLKVRNLHLPDSLTRLERESFCFVNPDSIHMPKNLKVICDGALVTLYGYCFYNLVLPEGLDSIGTNAITCIACDSLIIPASVRYLSSGALTYYRRYVEIKAPLEVIPTKGICCEGAKEIVLPKTVKRLETEAFGIPYALERITWPDSLEYIGNWVFAGNRMEPMVIPSSVKTIGNHAFDDNIMEGRTFYFTSPTPPVCLGEEIFQGIRYDKSVLYVPKGCKEAYAATTPWSKFGTISEYTDIELPPVSYRYDFEEDGLYYQICSEEDLTCRVSYEIGYITERNNYKYTSLTIPKTVTHDGKTYTITGIEPWAFADTPLRNVTIPKTAVNIDGAFYCCYDLTTFEIPETVTSIVRTFENCSKLQSIHLHDNITDISRAFSGCSSLKQIEIPESVVRLDGAFYGCDSLESIAFPDHFTEITEQTCGLCTSIKSVKLPANLQKIGKYAFGGCTSLKSIVLPAHLEYIEEDAFANDWALTEVISLNPVPPYSYARFSPFQVHNGTVHVPVGSKTAYQNESMWQYFTIIEDVEEALPIGQISIDHSATKSYDLLGRPSNGSNSGLFIKDKKIILRR